MKQEPITRESKRCASDIAIGNDGLDENCKSRIYAEGLKEIAAKI